MEIKNRRKNHETNPTHHSRIIVLLSLIWLQRSASFVGGGRQFQRYNIGTIVMDGAPSNAECKFWLKREEETNVHVEWEETLFSAWTTKKAAVLSAGDLPDAFILRGLVTDEEVASYGAAGTFIKLQDYITPEIMPNLAGYLEEHPDWKTAITAPDGNIYSLPSIDATAYTADSIP